MKRLFVVCALAVFMTITTAALAQELASITGVVTDSTGAVVPDVTVQLQDTKTNAGYETKTNDLGAYTFLKLLPGPGYKLTLSKEGFDAVTVSNIYIGVGTKHTQNVELKLGTVTQTVEVSGIGEAVTLNTTDNVVGKNFDMQVVQELPIQSRDSPAALLALQPGVVALGRGQGSDDPNASRDGAVTGARTDQINITVDGLDVNDFSTGQPFSIVGNAVVDSVQEFRAETANPLASSGRGGGGQVQIVTKGGTNRFHGAAFNYHRNTVTEANSLENRRAGLPRPKLIRNQFGANLGGPIIRNKLFFFFDYQGQRDASEGSASREVPLDSLRAGNVGYINSNAGCTENSRATTNPTCITYLNSAQMAGIDPQGVGFNTPLLSFLNSRYPQANDLSLGDGINTGGFVFNFPDPRTINEYVARVDYNLSDKMKLFGRITFLRDSSGDTVNFSGPRNFPGDPVTHEIIDHSYAYVLGHTWNISNTMVNQFYAGETRSDLNFPDSFNPVGTTFYQRFGPLSDPFQQQDTQHRIVPVPVIRDEFTYIRGRHNFQMGGTFKPIRTRSAQVNDFNFVNFGLGGNTDELSDDLRPTDILQDSGAIAIDQWDDIFTFALGRFGSINSNFNHDRDSNPLPQGTGHLRYYRYFETELYLQDTWRVRSDLTLTYGLRYQYYSVPYETSGLQAIPSLGFADFYNPRAQQGLAGDPNGLPLVSFDLGGKINNARGFYEPNWKDFAPRLGFSYNPSAKGGFLGSLFGDRKMVIRGGGGLIFDHPVTNALNFIQDQSNYLFQSSSSKNFGTVNDPEDSLLNDPRFTDIDSIPAGEPAPTITRPFTPNLDEFGDPIGTANGGQINYAIDPHLKTPYSITYSLGIQRELPGNFLFEADYVGRLGRRLMAQADAGQLADFRDPTSGHFLSSDFAALTSELRSGIDPNVDDVTPQPFFENQLFDGATQAIASVFQSAVTRGSLTDVIQGVAGFIPGVGLHPQFATNVYMTNKSYSNYNGLLMSLHKRQSHNLQFDLNYTYSHSIDNVSVPANNIFGTSNLSGGIICDAIRLDACRGNSDFDVRHGISGYYIYGLPIGRGQQFANGIPGWLDQVIGGWKLSGIVAWHSGFAYTTVSNSFPISFFNNAPAVFVGDQSAIKTRLHVDSTGAFQLFDDPTAARNAFRGPLGLEGGSRNNLRGPGYTNFDMGLAKTFRLAEAVDLKFRLDAFNVFNHVNFGLPGTGFSGGTTDITDPSEFGIIHSTAAPRQVQFALRLEF